MNGRETTTRQQELSIELENEQVCDKNADRHGKDNGLAQILGKHIGTHKQSEPEVSKRQRNNAPAFNTISGEVVSQLVLIDCRT